MRLVQIDLSRSVLPHEHPDVVTGHVYLLKKIPFQGNDFYITSGVATRHSWQGYSTLQFHVDSHLAQFDPPGHNHSNLVELWEVLDEPDIPAVQALELLREERQERRQGRSARRQKLERLEAEAVTLRSENETLIAIARAFRQALVLVENSQGYVVATEIARRVLQATPAPEVNDARSDGSRVSSDSRGG